MAGQHGRPHNRLTHTRRRSMRRGGSSCCAVDAAAHDSLAALPTMPMRSCTLPTRPICCSLPVETCRQDALVDVAQGHLSRPDVHAVTHQVYASPYRTAVNVVNAAAKAHPAEQLASYPDICFAIDDYEHAFGDVVGRTLLMPGWRWARHAFVRAGACRGARPLMHAVPCLTTHTLWVPISLI